MLTIAVGCAGAVAAWMLARSARRMGATSRAGALRTRTPAMPKAVRSFLAPRLEAADVALTPEAALQTWFLVVIVAALLGLAFAAVLAVPATGAALIAGPVGLHLARHRRDRRAAEAVPEVLERIAGEMRGGATARGAIENVAAGGGRLAADLTRVKTRVALGAHLTEALAAWPAERDVPGVRAAAGALALASDVGGPAADALDGLAASLRDRLGARAEARALSAQARLSAVVVGVLPLAYVLLSALIDPSSAARMYANPGGQVCLVAGLALEGAGAMWMRHLLGEREA